MIENCKFSGLETFQVSMSAESKRFEHAEITGDFE